MGAVEALIDAIPGVELVAQAAFLGTMAGTLHALGIGGAEGIEEWKVIGRWTIGGAFLGVLAQVLSELA